MLLRLDNKPRRHDYRKGRWGHALHGVKLHHETVRPSIWRWLRGDRSYQQTYMTCLGHGSVYPDDTVVIAMQSGKSAEFRVADIRYYSDPKDMFEIKRADFVGYLEDSTPPTDTEQEGENNG